MNYTISYPCQLFLNICRPIGIDTFFLVNISEIIKSFLSNFPLDEKKKRTNEFFFCHFQFIEKSSPTILSLERSHRICLIFSLISIGFELVIVRIWVINCKRIFVSVDKLNWLMTSNQKCENKKVAITR